MQKGLLLAKNRTLGKKEGKSMRKSVLLHFFMFDISRQANLC